MGRVVLDMWSEQREKAEVLSNGLRVYRVTDNRNRPCAMMFMPKAVKPLWNFYFTSQDSRERRIAETIANYDAAQQHKADARAARKTGDLSLMDPGTILSYSWGYDQTNVDFFQVVARCGTSVTIAKIGCETVPNSQGCMSERVVPVKDAFLTRCKHKCDGSDASPWHNRESTEFTHDYEPVRVTLTKRVQFSDGRPYLSMSCGIASPVKMLKFGNADALPIESHYTSHYH